MTKEARSALMSRIRSSGTKPERVTAMNLRASGIRFRRQADLPGRPDFLLPDLGTALFVHGCFWHGCPDHYRVPKSNAGFWEAKIARNRARDARAEAELSALGLSVAVLWEHDMMA